MTNNVHVISNRVPVQEFLPAIGEFLTANGYADWRCCQGPGFYHGEYGEFFFEIIVDRTTLPSKRHLVFKRPQTYLTIIARIELGAIGLRFNAEVYGIQHQDAMVMLTQKFVGRFEKHIFGIPRVVLKSLAPKVVSSRGTAGFRVIKVDHGI